MYCLWWWYMKKRRTQHIFLCTFLPEKMHDGGGMVGQRAVLSTGLIRVRLVHFCNLRGTHILLLCKAFQCMQGIDPAAMIL